MIDPLTDPTEVGLDAARVADLLARARREIDDGLLPSCQLALARHGRLVLDETIGAAPTTRYVVFSCTKGITAGVLWLLLGDGLLQRDTAIGDVLDAFAGGPLHAVTVEQLLTHTSGFPQAPLDPRRAADRAVRLAAYARWRQTWAPGTRFEYHPLAAHFVLGDLAEEVTGQPMTDLVRTLVCEPLGLATFSLGAPVGEQHDVAPLVGVGQPPTDDELSAVLGVPVKAADLIGEVTQDALLGFNDPAALASGAPGGGGVGRAADLAVYYQALLANDGDRWDADVLRAGTAEVLNDLPDPVLGVPAHRSLGLMIAGEGDTARRRGFPSNLSPRAFGHDGAGGQIAWADPDTGVSFAYLTNGLDAHVLREARRTVGLSVRAAGTPTPS